MTFTFFGIPELFSECRFRLLTSMHTSLCWSSTLSLRSPTILRVSVPTVVKQANIIMLEFDIDVLEPNSSLRTTAPSVVKQANIICWNLVLTPWSALRGSAPFVVKQISIIMLEFGIDDDDACWASCLQSGARLCPPTVGSVCQASQHS